MRFTPTKRLMRTTTGCALAAVLFLSGCSSSDDEASDASTTSTTAKTTEKNMSTEKPKVEIPDAAPPTELKVRDITEGTGKEAKTGDSVDMQYVGVSYSTKKEFDSSWSRGAQPFTFTLGQGRVITGWDEGIVGMKEGGRRELTIPPAKGYGARGAGADIGPNETLVFVVDLVSVK